MKTILLVGITLLTSSVALAQTQYRCSVDYYDNGDLNAASAENVIVKLDASESQIAQVKLTNGKWAVLDLLTFQTNQQDINRYGEYQFNAFIYQDINDTNSLLQAATSIFIGLDQAFATSAGIPKLNNLLMVSCNKL